MLVWGYADWRLRYIEYYIRNDNIDETIFISVRIDRDTVNIISCARRDCERIEHRHKRAQASCRVKIRGNHRLIYSVVELGRASARCSSFDCNVYTRSERVECVEQGRWENESDSKVKPKTKIHSYHRIRVFVVPCSSCSSSTSSSTSSSHSTSTFYHTRRVFALSHSTRSARYSYSLKTFSFNIISFFVHV